MKFERLDIKYSKQLNNGNNRGDSISACLSVKIHNDNLENVFKNTFKRLEKSVKNAFRELGYIV